MKIERYSLLPKREAEITIPEYQPDLKKADLISILGEDKEVENNSIFDANNNNNNNNNTNNIINSDFIDIVGINNTITTTNNNNNNNNVDNNNNNNNTTIISSLPPQLEKLKLKEFLSENIIGNVTRNILSKVACMKSNLSKLLLFYLFII